MELVGAPVDTDGQPTISSNPSVRSNCTPIRRWLDLGRWTSRASYDPVDLTPAGQLFFNPSHSRLCISMHGLDRLSVAVLTSWMRKRIEAKSDNKSESEPESEWRLALRGM